MPTLQNFAALTLRCELVHLAQRLLDAPPEFAPRRAMELAGLVLVLGVGAQVAQVCPPQDDAEGLSPESDIVQQGKGEQK